MFSKTALPVLGALAGTVVANPIQRAVAEAAANAVVPEVVFSPSPPLSTGGPGSRPAARDNLALTQEDNFYWTHIGEG